MPHKFNTQFTHSLNLWKALTDEAHQIAKFGIADQLLICRCTLVYQTAV